MSRILLAITLAAVPSVTTAAEDPKPSELIVEVGRGYYKEYCVTCHGKNATGDGPTAKALKTKPADLTRIAQRNNGRFDSVKVAATIDGRTGVTAHGTREMPVWGRRFAEQSGTDLLGREIVRGRLLILVEYLRSIQK